MDAARGSCYIEDFAIKGVDNSVSRVCCLHFPGVRVFKVHEMDLSSAFSVLNELKKY